MLITNALSSPHGAAGLIGLLLALCAAEVTAGSLNAPAAPTAAGSAMYTLQNLCDRLASGEAGVQRGGPFVEPTAGPAATMCTLNQIMAAMPTLDNASGAVAADVLAGKTFWGLTGGEWGLQLGSGKSTLVPKTGQTGCYDAGGTITSCTGTGQDGALQKGAALPSPRFTDNGNGTVTDNLTGLIWLKNANCFGARTWELALAEANDLANSTCGLTDSSVAGDWRLPNINELLSLIDRSQSSPALSLGHPFTGFVLSNSFYWSSTTYALANNFAWNVILEGYVNATGKGGAGYVWPVRGGL